MAASFTGQRNGGRNLAGAVGGKEDVDMSKTNGLKPGQEVPVSGQYRNRQERTEVTSTRGEPLPPTPKRNQVYDLVDPTKHRKS